MQPASAERHEAAPLSRTQGRRVEAQVVLHERRDKVVRVVVALPQVDVHRQRRVVSSRLRQVLRQQLACAMELVRRALGGRGGVVGGVVGVGTSVALRRPAVSASRQRTWSISSRALGPSYFLASSVASYAAHASSSAPRYSEKAFLPQGHAEGWQMGAKAETDLYLPCDTARQGCPPPAGLSTRPRTGFLRKQISAP